MVLGGGLFLMSEIPLLSTTWSLSGASLLTPLGWFYQLGGEKKEVLVPCNLSLRGNRALAMSLMADSLQAPPPLPP